MVNKFGDLFIRRRSGMDRLVLGSLINNGRFGEVFALAGPHSDLAIKVYTHSNTAAQNERKISWMIGHTPPLAEQHYKNKVYYQLAWPNDKVYNAGRQFVGFAMPKIDLTNALNLEWLMNEDNRKEKLVPEHYSFRLHVAWNLSALFSSLHESGVCVIDVKPDNILFYKDTGYACLLDCDSFIQTDKNELAIGAGWTLGYILPEARMGGSDYAPDRYREEQDKFALSVLIFRLMNEGLHPYHGKVVDPSLAGQNLEWQPLIDHGLYPYGIASNPRIKPAFQSRHKWFDDTTRQMFDRAFNSKNRPTASEWVEHLAEYVGPSATKLYKCKAKPRDHVHFSKGCDACFAEERLRKLKARSQTRRTATAAASPPAMPGVPTPPPFRPSPNLHLVQPPPPSPRSTPANIRTWQWITGIFVALLIISNFRSCASAPSVQPSSTSQPQSQTLESLPTDAATTAVIARYDTSFDCNRATAWTEQQICASQSLAESDRQLAALYSSALDRATGADKANLREGQRSWLRERNGCGDIPCIEQAFSERISYLQNWSPTPEPTPDASSDNNRLSSGPQAQDTSAPGTIICILPYGQEMQATQSECERVGGSVYR